MTGIDGAPEPPAQKTQQMKSSFSASGLPVAALFTHSKS